MNALPGDRVCHRFRRQRGTVVAVLAHPPAGEVHELDCAWLKVRMDGTGIKITLPETAWERVTTKRRRRIAAARLS